MTKARITELLDSLSTACDTCGRKKCGCVECGKCSVGKETCGRGECEQMHTAPVNFVSHEKLSKRHAKIVATREMIRNGHAFSASSRWRDSGIIKSKSVSGRVCCLCGAGVLVLPSPLGGYEVCGVNDMPIASCGN